MNWFTIAAVYGWYNTANVVDAVYFARAIGKQAPNCERDRALASQASRRKQRYVDRSFALPAGRRSNFGLVG